jgi:hypothetical protein
MRDDGPVLERAHRSGVTDDDVARSLPGDDLVPDARMVVDRATVLPAAPDAVWPWLVQLGKARAGWYAPRRVERLLPPSRRAARVLLDVHTRLAPGDRIPDYGGAHEQFEVVAAEAPHALVYRTLRRWPRDRPWPPVGAHVPDFAVAASWALVLDRAGPERSRLHVRLRARRGTWSARTEPLLWIGGWFDYLTIWAMFAGLRERVA